MVTLNDQELRRWQAWKDATEEIAARVRAEVRTATGLSPADLTVLGAIEQHARLGVARQQRLCDATGWTQSRMSNHIGRMERRELVRRVLDDDSPTPGIRIAEEGAARLARARPAEAKAVREALLEHLDDDVHDAIVAFAATLRES